MIEEPTRIALIGAGRVAATHVAMIQRTPGVEIVAVADPRIDVSRRLADNLQVPAYEGLQEVLATGAVDAVDIIVPHNLHYSLAFEALQAGVHVFMDKPLATNVADAAKLCEAADNKGVVLAICHNLLFHPASMRAGTLVHDGVLGRPTRASAVSSGWLDLPAGDFRLDESATGGGAWVDGSPHLVYLLESLLGPISAISAFAARGETRIGGEDTAVGQAQFENGGVATVAVGYSDASAGEVVWPDGWELSTTLHGTGGRIILELLPSARVTWEQTGHLPIQEDYSHVPFETGFDGAFADFVSAVRTGSSLQVPPRESLRNLELVQAAMYRDGGVRDTPIG
ncbi:Gfo/Idh/MocA family oxidoreductase [Arthrobacter sp. H5]|uniref:Gfo/Idh/MocA family protein n=1 Tax=Arthrobacter sp. H5 TaxID=1267973 RepID=UPI000685E037|nr:Gfo/Idh/MocA family oxidoreductase [Arthrobacter sp. H5]